MKQKNTDTTVSKIVDNLYKTYGKKVSCDSVTKKFQRILRKLDDSSSENKLEDIYKSMTEINDETKRRWIFYNSKELIKINKKIHKTYKKKLLHESCISSYFSLIEKARKIRLDYEKFNKDASVMMNELFELWKDSKGGYFTSSENDVFEDLLLCLIPCQEKWLTKSEKMFDSETEKNNYIKKLAYKLDKNKGIVQNAIYKNFLNTRNSEFYRLRIYNKKSGNLWQYKLVGHWKDKWKYIMDTAYKIKQFNENKELAEKYPRIKRLNTNDLKKFALILYYGKLLWKNDEKNNGNESVLKDKKDIDITENDFKNCIDEIVNHQLKNTSKENYYLILCCAFEDLEKKSAAAIVEHESKEKIYLPDIEKRCNILEELLEIINPNCGVIQIIKPEIYQK